MQQSPLYRPAVPAVRGDTDTALSGTLRARSLALSELGRTNDVSTAGGIVTDDWSGDMGDKWNKYLDQFESMIAPVGAAAIEHARFEPGETVLDIGCGGADTSLEIAKVVGTSGHVTGLDLSATLIATARQRAETNGVTNTDFVCADAATVTLSKGYDHLFSRFGLMFFEDPPAAFRHIHGLAQPGARLDFSCWAPPSENPWVSELLAIVADFVEMPPPDPTAPGPFTLADRDATLALLEQAGFKDVAFTLWTGQQLIGGAGASPATATQFLFDALFVGEAFEDQPENVVSEAKARFEKLLAQHHSADGVAMPASAWFVTASH